MAKIHPKTSIMMSDSSNCQLSSSSLERETYTVWMKSLVMNGNGCTVFNSKGEVVFRVDNYQKIGCSEVFLMNSNGRVLFSIKRKNLLMMKSWEGYKCNSNCKLNDYEEGEWFRVKKMKSKIFGRDNRTSSKWMQVIVGSCNKNRVSYYNIENGFELGKSMFKIVDCDNGRLLAEVKQKHASGGVCLGADVLSLMVEPNIDQSLIMALVIVHGMINGKL